ncbi:PBSX family phage terminase large subunit [Lactiplantibacillus fabifermentans]|uniref:Terminase large subunit n=1 Tax=Lactiplantibacillus fabifermentans DSM 21115 TaxID=1413187 RepID=A0A0R2NRZ5_9LACO|nr:PBSX family phage terminase large subunit [Lactiplantibacillus fabifermentans]KRO28457.1 terminase large subunit [Lactiplantibacillus fabifermentans DSM 21115]
MKTLVVDDTKIKKVIRISDLINPHFKRMWLTDKPYIVANGGRGSFKSSVISLKLVTMMKKAIQQRYKANIICILANKTDLHDTVYKQIQWAIDLLQLNDEFRAYKSPLTIQHKRTGSTFYFYGADNPYKLKSNVVGNVIAVWYEEAANMKSADVFDQSNPTFIRQKPDWLDQVKVYYSYNPPKNPYDWINEWIDKVAQNPAYLIDTSDYRCDVRGFTSEQTLALINQYKKTDYDYYRWLYLGEIIGLGTSVYNSKLLHPLETFPDDDHIASLYFSQDTGQQVSATTELCIAITAKKRVILLDTFYYSPVHQSEKRPPSELAKDLYEFEMSREQHFNVGAYNYTADEAVSDYAIDHEYYRLYGRHWHHVNKVEKTIMIDHVQDLLATGRFYYINNEANQIFVSEHRKYQWDADSLQTDKPKVVKVDDHTVDAFQYFVLDNLADLDLKY